MARSLPNLYLVTYSWVESPPLWLQSLALSSLAKAEMLGTAGASTLPSPLFPCPEVCGKVGQAGSRLGALRFCLGEVGRGVMDVAWLGVLMHGLVPRETRQEEEVEQEGSTELRGHARKLSGALRIEPRVHF